jgi:hypothetical protein
MKTTVEEITLSDNTISIIKNYLETELTSSGKKAIPMPKIFIALQDKIEAEFPEVKVNSFNKAFSKAIVDNRVVGYRTYLGKSGGVGRADYVKPVPEIVISTAVVSKKETCVIVYKNQDFTIDMKETDLVKLFTKVVGLKQDDDGELTFGGITYSIVDETIRGYIDNFVLYFGLADEDVRLSA